MLHRWYMQFCRRLSILILLGLFPLSVSAFFMDGHLLMEMMNAEKNPNTELGFDAGVFNGYITAIADVQGDVSWCPPNSVQMNQISDIVSRYLLSHSENLHRPAVFLVMTALEEVYPCR